MQHIKGDRISFHEKLSIYRKFEPMGLELVSMHGDGASVRRMHNFLLASAIFKIKHYDYEILQIPNGSDVVNITSSRSFGTKIRSSFPFEMTCSFEFADIEFQEQGRANR